MHSLLLHLALGSPSPRARTEATLAPQAVVDGVSGLPPTAYVSTFSLLSVHPHCDHSPCDAFTEGLAFGSDGALYESAGGYGEGSVRGVRSIDLRTGAANGTALAQRDGQFAEGLTVLPGERLVQLTYRENEVNEYVARSTGLAYVRTTNVALGAEGWGLTRSADGTTLYATDSTDQLLHVNASTLQLMRSVPIVDPQLDGGRHVWGVNELELVGDEVRFRCEPPEHP